MKRTLNNQFIILLLLCAFMTQAMASGSCPMATQAPVPSQPSPSSEDTDIDEPCHSMNSTESIAINQFDTDCVNCHCDMCGSVSTLISFTLSLTHVTLSIQQFSFDKGVMVELDRQPLFRPPINV